MLSNKKLVVAPVDARKSRDNKNCACGKCFEFAKTSATAHRVIVISEVYDGTTSWYRCTACGQ